MIVANIRSNLLSGLLCLAIMQGSVHAQDEWDRCKNNAGICYDTTKFSCSVAPILGVGGLCPNGNNDVLCCPLPGGIAAGSGMFNDAADCVEMGGTCKREEDCFFGVIKANLCPGPDEVKCCIEDKCCNKRSKSSSNSRRF